ncbi:YbhN family protein [Alkalihalobacillus sp. R86527]|uniref:lysylphosphatidylglycerol synthase transmembrane domain-containing protein n=1 Tax=Alkalihalobacillus sp. R86527 TaxID=3093863 RepID=UPI0036713431
MGKKILRVIKVSIGLSLLILFLWFLIPLVNIESLSKHSSGMFNHPVWLIIMFVGYTIAFLLRALSWKLVINRKVSYKVFLSGVFYSLFFNHILPFKGGEAIRIGTLAQHPEVRVSHSLKTVVSLRSLDLIWIGLFAIIGATLIGINLNYRVVIISSIVGIVTLAILFIIHKLRKLPTIVVRQFHNFKKLLSSKTGLMIVLLSGASWIAEGVVVYGVARFSASTFSYIDAIWVTSLSVGAGVFQLAPGGLATYESVMSFSLYQYGFNMEDALSVALITHGFKYLYSFAAGALAFYMYPLRLHKLKSFLSKKGETQ